MKPKSVRIIGKTYSIVWTDGKPLDEDDVGEFDPANQRIAIKNGQPKEQEQDTLLHEILHGIDQEMNLKMKEAQVHGMATGLLAVIKDNPRLVGFLRRK